MPPSTDAKVARVYLILNPAPGGTETLLRRLTRFARQRGIRARVLAPGEDARCAAKEQTGVTTLQERESD
jgi:hypothetical protein